MNNRTAIITPEKFPTALVDNERAIPFKPSSDQVKALENKLNEYLKVKYPDLAKKFSKYYRQYSGLRVGTKETIHANFFCSVTNEKWKSEWVSVKGGGDCYFAFVYEVQKSNIDQFTVNGYR